VFTEAMWDQIRANFQAGVPDIFAAKGDLAVATGADAASRLAAGANDATLVPDSSTATGLAWQIQPACRVYNSTDIDTSIDAWYTLTFDAERFDTDAMHDLATNPERLTIPTGGAGLYLIGACVEFGHDGGPGINQVGVRILLNATTVISQVLDDIARDRNIALSPPPALYALNVGDFVEVQVTTHYDVHVIASGNYSPVFWAVWQRRQ